MLLSSKTASATILNSLLTGYMQPGNLRINILGQVRLGSLSTYIIGAIGGYLSSMTAEYFEQMNTPIMAMMKQDDSLNGLMTDALLHGLSYAVTLYVLNPSIYNSVSPVQMFAIGLGSEVGAQLLDMRF